MTEVTAAPAHDPDPDLFGGRLPVMPVPPCEAAPIAPRKRSGSRRKGLSPVAMALPFVAVAAVLWGAWMTKAVADLKAHKTPIAAVHLQPLIEEYVQGQARSGTPEQLVMRQTQAFMAALDAELLKRGQNGTTVLVAEAVLSKNVPDVTADVRRAVYAKVEAPAPGPQAQLGGPAMAGSMAPAGMGAR
jgi:hypothetical protein